MHKPAAFLDANLLLATCREANKLRQCYGRRAILHK